MRVGYRLTNLRLNLCVSKSCGSWQASITFRPNLLCSCNRRARARFLSRLKSILRFLSCLGALGMVLGWSPGFLLAQSTGHALLSGTVTDSTGAVIRGAAVHLAEQGATDSAVQSRDT